MDYPPLTTLEECALHGKTVTEECYYACAFPEAPPTEFTMYDWRCRSCIRSAQARIHSYGDVSMAWYPMPGNFDYVIEKTLSWLVERAMFHHGMS